MYNLGEGLIIMAIMICIAGAAGALVIEHFIWPLCKWAIIHLADLLR